MESYSESLNFVGESDDSLYPDFLFNPIFNDFDDNYYEQSFVQDDLSAQIKKLRRRYSNFFQWVAAMQIYNDYMEKMIERYGSMRVIKNAIKAGVLIDPIPAKPKLKNTRRNRQYLRSGIVPTQKIHDNISSEEMLAIARQALPGKFGQDVDENDIYKKLPKATRKRLEEIQEQMAGKSRKRNLYRSVGNNAGTDFIVEYLNQAKQGNYDSSGNRINNYENKSILDIVREEERLEGIRPELLEDESEHATVIKNGRLVRKSELNKMEIYKELYGEGLDIIGTLGRTMDKKAVKMIRSQIGATEPASKKELKKLKKQRRKDAERIERRRDQNELLEKTLLGNKFDLSRKDDKLSFRLSDLM